MTAQHIDLFRLDGKSALITGAGGGIGRAVSLGMAAQGAAITCVDIDEGRGNRTVELVQQAGGRASALIMDVGSTEAAELAVAKAVEEFGSLDILVNLAGNGILKPALDYNLEEWGHMENLYLRSTFLFCQAAGAVMLRQGSGSVINISSISSIVALGRGTAVYAAMKAGVNGLTRELALEWARGGVRVNAIAPCQIDTPQLRAMLEDPQFDAEQLMKKWLSYIPIGRLGRPEELVGPCVFLGSNASSLVTGHVLVVDGGYTIH